MTTKELFQETCGTNEETISSSEVLGNEEFSEKNGREERSTDNEKVISVYVSDKEESKDITSKDGSSNLKSNEKTLCAKGDTRSIVEVNNDEDLLDHKEEKIIPDNEKKLKGDYLESDEEENGQENGNKTNGKEVTCKEKLIKEPFNSIDCKEGSEVSGNEEEMFHCKKENSKHHENQIDQIVSKEENFNENETTSAKSEKRECNQISENKKECLEKDGLSYKNEEKNYRDNFPIDEDEKYQENTNKIVYVVEPKSSSKADCISQSKKKDFTENDNFLTIHEKKNILSEEPESYKDCKKNVITKQNDKTFQECNDSRKKGLNQECYFYTEDHSTEEKNQFENKKEPTIDNIDIQLTEKYVSDHTLPVADCLRNENQGVVKNVPIDSKSLPNSHVPAVPQDILIQQSKSKDDKQVLDLESAEGAHKRELDKKDSDRKGIEENNLKTYFLTPLKETSSSCISLKDSTKIEEEEDSSNICNRDEKLQLTRNKKLTHITSNLTPNESEEMENYYKLKDSQEPK